MSSDTFRTSTLSRRIKEEAAALGFPLTGILPAGPNHTHAFYEDWLARGYAGEMAYLHRHAEAKRDSTRLEPSARSVIVLGHAYGHQFPAPAGGDAEPRGRISRYAWAQDYHEVIRVKIERLAAFIERELGRPLGFRVCVDTAPMMEREVAARTGLGWVGKNAMLIHWKLGSWLFLAELLVDVALDYDRPRRPRGAWNNGDSGATVPPARAGDELSAGLNLLESCGSCTACIDACPTNAIVADKTVDARRCISYLTVELKGPIPEALRPAMGDWVFGCDICQDVCPWNRKAQPGEEAAFKGGPEGARPSLAALLALDDTAFRQRFRHTALWRAKRRGVLRNAAIALGNVAAESASRKGAGQRGLVKQALPALAGALADAEPLVRGAAAWALGRIGTPNARKAVSKALGAENDASVRGEMTRALGQSGTPASGDGAPFETVASLAPQERGQ